MRSISIAHSPDSDDAFMFYALQNGKITSPNYRFHIERRDIEELNQIASQEVYDITALSMHAYAHVSDRYVLTRSACSMAEKDYGPMVVAREPLSQDALHETCVAIPGDSTTAALILRLAFPGVKTTVLPFDEIMTAVSQGQVKAGLLIHEGQLQYQDQNLHHVFSLLDFWKSLAGDLPLPLGGSAIKKSLGQTVIHDLAKLQTESIRYALEQPEAARDYAMSFKRDLTTEQADRYLSWYANERTLDLGDDGEKALQILFNQAHQQGILHQPVSLELV